MIHLFIDSQIQAEEISALYQKAFTELFTVVTHVLDNKLTFFSKRHLKAQLQDTIKETDTLIIMQSEWLNILPKNLKATNIFWVVTTPDQPHKLIKAQKKYWPNLALIVPSEYAQKKCLEWGFAETTLHIITPPFLAPLNMQAINSPATFILGVKTDLKEGQGLESVLQAVHNLREILPHLQLIIIGDGPDKRKFMWLIEHLALKRQVQIISGFADYYKFFSNFSALVIPDAKQELFDARLLYAFAYQVPIIATDAGCHKDMIQNGKSGLLFVAGNYHTLEQHIINLCNHPDWLSHYRQIGPQLINEKYSINTFINACKQIFR